MNYSGLFFYAALLLLPATGSLAQNGSNSSIVNPSFMEPEFSGPVRLAEPNHAEPGSFQQMHLRDSLNGNGTLSPAAVPPNNDCANAITLTVNAPCVNGTNKEGTVQGGENTSCQGAVTKTVWYKFVATAAVMYVEVERTASSGCYLSSAVYSGSCLPSSSISCEDAASGPNLNIHNLTGLTTGATYFIQVSYTGGMFCGNNNNAGTGADFCILVGTPQVCNTCSSTCGPMCIFPTNPTVAQVTSTCTAYQLTSRLNAGQTRTQCYTFTAVAASFNLQMIINSVGCGAGGNVTSFNWQLYPSNCGSVIQSGNLSNLNATGLTIGSAYVLCYTWTAACQHNTVYPYIVATSPLPITLLQFGAKQMENNIRLDWSTGSEINNDHFSIERSRDGITFESIGQVTGAGNSNQTISYRFTDYTPLPGLNYYRLQQQDYDGRSSVSGIIAVRFYKNFSVKVENNPVEDVLLVILNSETASTLHMQLINDLGQTVLEISRNTTKGQNRFEIPVEQLQEGMYFLKSENKSGISWSRFLKL